MARLLALAPMKVNSQPSKYRYFNMRPPRSGKNGTLSTSCSRLAVTLPALAPSLFFLEVFHCIPTVTHIHPSVNDGLYCVPPTSNCSNTDKIK